MIWLSIWHHKDTTIITRSSPIIPSASMGWPNNIKNLNHRWSLYFMTFDLEIVIVILTVAQESITEYGTLKNSSCENWFIHIHWSIQWKRFLKIQCVKTETSFCVLNISKTETVNFRWTMNFLIIGPKKYLSTNE